MQQPAAGISPRTSYGTDRTPLARCCHSPFGILASLCLLLPFEYFQIRDSREEAELTSTGLEEMAAALKAVLLPMEPWATGCSQLSTSRSTGYP